MAQIHMLSRHVSDLIAAGEVVERPASVVKELIENALDAGASAITVEIKNGGVSYIRVTDDGKGIERADVQRAFLRHATSKIQNKEDLTAIGTLGFRGEALAAIASVSRMEAITKTAYEDIGTHIALEGGEELFCREAGCPSGTTMTVRELFYNTPARRKFLKRDATEAGYIQSVLERAALSRADVSFRFIRDGVEVLHTAGDNRVVTVVYCLFGRGLYEEMISCETDYEGIRVTGMVTRPSASRGSRNLQFFFVNGRPVKNRTLSTALEAAFKNMLMTGRFPACILYLELDMEQVDVNVHPAKTEVKFSDERRVFDGVYFSVKAALEKDAFMPEMIRETTEPVQSEKPLHELIYKQTAMSEQFPDAPLRQTPTPYRAEPEADIKPEVPFIYNEPAETKPERGRDYRIIGELFGLFILVEIQDELLFIDKHAAHERMIFNSMKKNIQKPISQQLLSPIVAVLSRVETDALMQNAEVLSAAGFEAELFGANELLIRQAPDCIAQDDIVPLVGELAQAFVLGHQSSAEEILDGALHSIACKSALRSGDRISQREMDVLVAAVLELSDVKYCPHGRPVAMVMKRSQVDKYFKRIL